MWRERYRLARMLYCEVGLTGNLELCSDKPRGHRSSAVGKLLIFVGIWILNIGSGVNCGVIFQSSILDLDHFALEVHTVQHSVQLTSSRAKVMLSVVHLRLQMQKRVIEVFYADI